MSFIAELRRRNVFKAGIAYVLVSWLILQAGDVLGPALRLPDWSNSLLAFFLILGFPVVLVLAWAFELTPEGIKPETGGTTPDGATTRKGRGLDVLVIVLLLVALAYFFWESRYSDRPVETPAVNPEQPENIDEDGQVAAPEMRKVAVLPFANVSEDQNKEYFSDGMTEEVINALVSVQGISVPARTTIFGFKDYAGDIREIGRTLGVAYVLEGSVRTVGDEARITASLVDMESGLPVWSETYERHLDRIFAVQDEIARAIAGELAVKLDVGDAVPNRTSDMAAYDSYLRGRAALRRRDGEAVELLEAATRSDPNFAPAWASLAISYQALGGTDDQTIDAAQRALQIDPVNIDALTALGSVHRQMQRWGAADTFFNRALAIDPGSAELLEDYAEFLNVVGRSREALEVAERGMEIDPRLRPLVAAYAEALLSTGRPEDARRVVTESLDANGGGLGLWWVSLPLWLVTGMDQEPPPSGSDDYTAAFEFVSGMLASPDNAAMDQLRAALDPARAGDVQLPVGRRSARLLLLHFGDVDFVLDQDIENPSFFPDESREWLWSPLFDDYRAHTRFPEFLARVGIMDYWNATSMPPACQKLADGTVQCH